MNLSAKQQTHTIKNNNIMATFAKFDMEAQSDEIARREVVEEDPTQGFDMTLVSPDAPSMAGTSEVTGSAFSHSQEDRTAALRASISRSLPSVWLRIPNTSFGIAVGLAGQAILWKSAKNADFISDHVATATINYGFWVTAVMVGVLFFTASIMKCLFYYPLIEDEMKDPSRVHFFNMPHLVLVMLAIGVPEDDIEMMNTNQTGQRILWTIGFFAQLGMTSFIYERWLFSEAHSISCAKPQFLLSTVGWFLLSTLGSQAHIEQAWGIALPTFCLGVGTMFYLMVAIAIMNGLHHTPNAKGSPALFLLIAPPSVGVVAFDLINDEPGELAMMSLLLLGWCMGILLLLFKLGPKISNQPPVLGAYWAYVFPLSAFATACIRYAWAVNTRGAEYMAAAAIALATVALFVVFCRMCVHSYRVVCGKAVWGDPLLSPERLVSSSLINYSELIYYEETA